MFFIDSHCHLHDPRIIADVSYLENRAEAAGVKYMVSCATMEENFELTAQLSKKFSSVLPCFGIHPWFIETVSGEWKKTVANYLQTYPSGIGETGLDFTDKSSDREKQVKVFTYHLMLAREMKLPINIHIRNAWDTFIHLLKKFGKLSVPGMIHSYSGSADMIPLFEKLGLYISFSGSVTNPGAKKVIKALKAVSKNRFVLETDTPDIYPYLSDTVPSADSALRLNEPENLPAIASVASQRAGVEQGKFVKNAYHNSLELFNSILPHPEKQLRVI